MNTFRPRAGRSGGLHLIGIVAIVLLAALGMQSWLSPRAAAQSTAASHYKVFLPIVTSPGASSNPGDPGDPGDPDNPATSAFFFMNREAKNNSADIATDANGGMHAAYAYYTPDVDHPPAVYTYCPGPASACVNPAAWASVKLGDLADEVQLALTPAGQPRLLIVTTSTLFDGGKDYFYAACNAQCTQQASWTLTRVLTSDGTAIQDVNDDRAPQRSFAIDPQGRPRFFYQDRNYLHAEPDHIGAYYAWCDANCTSAENWQEVRVGNAIETTYRRDYEIYKYPALTFTPEGHPRVITRIFAFNEDGSEAPEGLYYVGCDAQCGQHESWQRTYLMPTGSGSYPYPGWDVDLTTGGRPRVALFTGGGLQPDSANYRLFYLWCDNGCFDSNNWGLKDVGLPSNSGQSADLELDAQERPRLAYMDANGDLGYGWCNTDCGNEATVWEQRTVETEGQLKQDFPQAIPPHCDADTWEGLAPALALDTQGNPRIDYDVAINARCYYDDTPDDKTDPPTIRFEPVWRGVRLAFFQQP